MSIPQNLHPPSNGPWLTPDNLADMGPFDPSDERYIWLDSSLELQRGLDVVDLEVEVVSTVLQTPTERG